jgi:hypothetical protein
LEAARRTRGSQRTFGGTCWRTRRCGSLASKQ